MHPLQPVIPPPQAVGTGAVHAHVHAAGVVTRYRRGGGGEPLVLLGFSEDPPYGELMAELSSVRRVIAPDRWRICGAQGADASPFPPMPLAGWLGPFLDGLGLLRTPLVAVGRLALPALGFALREPGRVAALVLVSEDPSTELTGTAERLETAGVRLVLLDVPAANHVEPWTRSLLRHLAEQEASRPSPVTGPSPRAPG